MSGTLYRPANLFVAMIHPSTRILAMLGLFIPPFFNEDPLLQSAYLLFLIFAACLGKSIFSLWKLKTIILTIFTVSVLMWSILLPGKTVLYSIGPLVIRQEALLVALARGLRLISLLTTGILFLTTTSVEEFTFGLHRLGLPYRACFSLTLAFRLTPLFVETAKNIVTAQRTRGLEIEIGGPLRRLKSYFPVLIPVIVSGFHRSNALAVALEAKGFGLPDKRTFLLTFSFGWRDALLLCSVFSLIFVYYFSTVLSFMSLAVLAK